MNLLLVSNSTQHGSGYLDHCAEAAQELFAGRNDLVFVPYAIADLDGYAATAIERFERLGFRMTSVHQSADPAAAVREAGGVFVGGGNTFRLLKKTQEAGLIEAIRDRVRNDEMPYMGTSAGANLACPTICTTNDMPIVQPATFEALDLVPFQINAHYLDADPDSTHKGETRAQRIKEYLEENDRTVIGLREGAWVRVRGSERTLAGARGAVRFARGSNPVEVSIGEQIVH